MSNFLPSVGGFSPNMSLVNPQDMKLPYDIGGMYGAALPQGMINRDGQQFMGQQQPQMQQPASQEGMSQGDMMKLAGMAMQGFNRGQQAPQAPTQQIMRDSNQFRFAGQQQNPQMLAQALRNRG